MAEFESHGNRRPSTSPPLPATVMKVPPTNVRIYEYLYLVETTLRELIIEQMQGALGPKWFKVRFPIEAREHFFLGIAADRATHWTQNVPHHPVYYLGFPDLRLIIEQRDNWSDVFKQVFSKTKELVTTDLIELEFIRNKIAHNRRASVEDLHIVEAAYSKLLSMLTPTRAMGLASRYTIASDIPGAVKALEREAAVSYALVAGGRRLRFLPEWLKARTQYWWFDDAYLGGSTKGIESLFGALELGLQSGSSIVERSMLAAAYQVAKAEFATILAIWRPGPPATKASI